MSMKLWNFDFLFIFEQTVDMFLCLSFILIKFPAVEIKSYKKKTTFKQQTKITASKLTENSK